MRDHNAKDIIRAMVIALVASAILLGPQSAPPVYAQANTLRFDNLSTEQGLSQSTVTAILQDRQGFMWFGTEGGLDKYDGYQFTVYKHDADNHQSLSDNVVTSLYEDRDGMLWIGTSAGLDRFDRKTGAFQQDLANSYSLSGKFVLAIFQDHSGTLWVGTEGGGLGALDLATNQFTVYKHAPDDPQSLSDNTINSIYEGHDGVLWIGTGAGLDWFDRKTGTFAHYRQDPSGSRILGNAPVYAIYEDVQGALWVGTKNGLVQWNRGENHFVEYRHDPNVPDSISDDSIISIYEDFQGVLWIGTRSGLDQFDKTHKLFAHYAHNPNDPYSLISDSIRAIYEDRSGVLWIGTSGGLSKYARATQKFALYKYTPGLSNNLSDNNIWSIYEDRNGTLWVGTFFSGLDKLDRSSGTVTVYQNNPAEPASLSENEIRAIFQDHNGFLWVGTERGGLNRFDPKTETFIHYRHNTADPSSLSDDAVFSINEDRLGRLWIGTQSGGLDRLDQALGTFTHYQHDASDPSSLSNNNVKTIYKDRAGVLWIGTLGGINLWDDHVNHFTVYRHDPKNPSSLSSDLVSCIFEDQKGIIWIGTFGGGLNRFDRVTHSFTHYTEKDGLPDDTVYGILADQDGSLWLSTNKGLSKFNPLTETFRNYDISDGLQGNQFNPGAYFQSTSGEMFFGGTQGLNGFYPEQVKDNPIPPSLMITAFKKFNQTIQTDLTPNETIRLSYTDYFISFEFVALDYNAPEKNQYAYKLDGVDKDWVNAGTRRYASYTYLRGGDYVFRVKGSNNDGTWNSEGIALRISVTPPFWETWWFIGIIGLALAASVIGSYRLRVRSVEARNRELVNRVEQRTHELAALNAIAAVVSRSLDLKEVMSAALEKIIEVTGMEMGIAYRFEEDEQDPSLGHCCLNSIASRGVPESLLQHVGHLQLQGPRAEGGAMIEQLVVWRISEYPTPDIKQALERERVQLGISVPLLVKENLVGAIFLATRTPRLVKPEELELLAAISQQVGIAVENARLYEQAEQSAAVTERSRLARELHDSVTQSLYSVTLYAEAAAELLSSGETGTAAEHLRELRDTAQEALREMRLLIFELRPPALDKGGLVAALQTRLDAVEARGGMQADLQVEGSEALPRAIQVELYNIAQEALNNALKHAQAHRVQVRLQFEEALTWLQVCDDGVGFEPAIARLGGGFGISGMKERAQRIGGTLLIKSAPGQGTSVTVQVPTQPKPQEQED